MDLFSIVKYRVIKNTNNLLLEYSFFIEWIIIIKNVERNFILNKIENFMNKSIEYKIKILRCKKELDNILLINHFLLNSICKNTLIIQNNNSIYEMVEIFLTKKSKILDIVDYHFVKQYQRINKNELYKKTVDGFYFTNDKKVFFNKIKHNHIFIDILWHFINTNNKKVIIFNKMDSKWHYVIKEENNVIQEDNNKNNNFENYLEQIFIKDSIRNIITLNIENNDIKKRRDEYMRIDIGFNVRISLEK